MRMDSKAKAEFTIINENLGNDPITKVSIKHTEEIQLLAYCLTDTAADIRSSYS